MVGEPNKDAILNRLRIMTQEEIDTEEALLSDWVTTNFSRKHIDTCHLIRGLQQYRVPHTEVDSMPTCKWCEERRT